MIRVPAVSHAFGGGVGEQQRKAMASDQTCCAGDEIVGYTLPFAA